MWEVIVPAVFALAGVFLGLIVQPWVDRKRIRAEREAEDTRQQAKLIEQATARCLDNISDLIDECRRLSELTFTEGTAERYARAEDRFHAAWHRAWAAYPGIADKRLLDFLETAYTNTSKWIRAEVTVVENEGRGHNGNPSPTKAMEELIWAAQERTQEALPHVVPRADPRNSGKS